MVYLTVLVLLVMAGGAALILRQSPPAGEAEAPVPIGGPFTLVDETGRTVTADDFKGRMMLVYFGYTFCPDVCPTSLQRADAALALLTPDERAQVRLVFITVDPDRDTVAQMRDYVALFDPPPVGLTGTKAQVAAAAKAYRVYYQTHEDQGPDYPVDHSSYYYLMGKDGTFVTFFSHDATPEAMAEGIRKHL
ncbi:MAG: SCO family protein [Geminicoccaceae bacterium]|nr:SCO family protein [Geminicoccaceae bacterium]